MAPKLRRVPEYPASITRSCDRSKARVSQPYAIRIPALQQRHGGPITMQRADVDIGAAGFDTNGFAALLQPCIHQSADVFVAAVTFAPQPLQFRQNAAGHLEGTPNPP